jgi:hypothetical protein
MEVIFTSNPNDIESNDEKIIFDEKLSAFNYGSIGKIKKAGVGNTKLRCYQVLVDNFGSRWGIKGQKDMTIALAAHSLHCLKSLGAEVVLYTDIPEMKLLPYDEVHLIEKSGTKFWAGSKIQAMLAELGKQSCILDTDVFIYDETILQRINNSENIVSHEEDPKGYREYIKKYGDLVNETIGKKWNKFHFRERFSF